jgi:GTP-binding protein
VEGAHRGRGLGHKFLKHIERTRLFVHLLDGTKLLEDLTEDENGAEKAIEQLIERYQQIREELRLFNEDLMHKPEIVVLNKGDLFESDPAFTERARKALRMRINSIRGTHPVADEPLLISSATGAGIPELLNVVTGELRHQTQALREKESFLPDSDVMRT